MRIINDNQFVNVENDKANESRKADSKKGVAADVKSKKIQPETDTLTLSSSVRDVAEIALQLKEASEVREDKVSELKDLIQSGNYSISGKDIATKIMFNAINKTF